MYSMSPVYAGHGTDHNSSATGGSTALKPGTSGGGPDPEFEWCW